MARVKFKLTGDEAMRRRMEALAKKVPDAAERALRVETEQILTVAKQKYVPVNLGPLRASGRVVGTRRQGRRIIAEMSFGNNAAPYALAVHEHPSPYSPPTWRGKPIEGIHSVRTGKPWSLDGRGPKYLERPLLAAIPGMAERIARAIDAEVR